MWVIYGVDLYESPLAQTRAFPYTQPGAYTTLGTHLGQEHLPFISQFPISLSLSHTHTHTRARAHIYIYIYIYMQIHTYTSTYTYYIELIIQPFTLTIPIKTCRSRKSVIVWYLMRWRHAKYPDMTINTRAIMTNGALFREWRLATS